MDSNARPPLEIRDPIHGAIQVGVDERAVIDHPFVQRLRGIRQLGFSHLPFPGATHSRYSHSLGAMHLAGRAFDACFRGADLPSGRRDSWRSCLRLAALCHDLGHGPFSHAAEFAMPPLEQLGVGVYDRTAVAERLGERAHHEDYTIALLTRSGVADVIGTHFGFAPVHVAALVSPDVVVDDDFFVYDGHDLRGVLSQIVSSDLDVDRLDYLVRDSYYTGARYGQVDVNWLISNLTFHIDERGRVCLALGRRAIYAFDDFMIARFHMFVMVYFHQKSIAYEHMLRAYMLQPGCPYRLSSELDAYLQCDDAELVSHLRSSRDPWARRIVEMTPFRLALEVHGTPGQVDIEEQRTRLDEAGIETLHADARGAVFKKRLQGSLPLYVVERRGAGCAQAVRLEEATAIFRRYEDERSISRLYVAPENLARARELLREPGVSS